MNPNLQNRQINNLNNYQNNTLLKNKNDLIRENQQINSQKKFINHYENDKLDYNIGTKKNLNNKSNTNNLIQNKQIIHNNINFDKSLNLSNTQDLTRHLSGNKMKKNLMTNVTILSPKAQKEILNNRINNANFNENLFQKNINSNVNNQTFEGNNQKIKHLKVNTNFTPKGNQINQNLFPNNENSLFPNTTKYSYNQDFISMKNINKQNTTNSSNANNSGNNINNGITSQNSILNDYNNLSKKLFSKSKFKGNFSHNPTGAENISIGNNVNNSNSQSNKNTKENFSSNKLTNKINNSNSLSINFNNTNNPINSNTNTNNSNMIGRKANASPYKNDPNINFNINQKNLQGITGKSMEINLNQLNSNYKNSRNKSNNHNYTSTNVNNTNQTTIKNNLNNNIYSTNFIDATNNKIISRNANNKINFENTLKFSGTIQENNHSNNNIQRLIKTKLDNTMNMAQVNLNRNNNNNSKSRFNYDNILNNSKSNINNLNNNNPNKSKSPSIFNQNKFDNLHLNNLNILNTDSDLNGELNNINNKNHKSKSINIIGKNQIKSNNQNSSLNTAGRNTNNSNKTNHLKNNYNKSENEFLNNILINPQNMKPSNATFNSSLQNRLNIYSIGSDYNSPHIVETDENIKNVKSQEDQNSNDLIDNNEENNPHNYYQEHFDYNGYEANEHEDLVNQQMLTNENDEAQDKNKYFFLKKENLEQRNNLNYQNTNKLEKKSGHELINNKLNLPNETLLMYSKNIIHKKNLINQNQNNNARKINANKKSDSNSKYIFLKSGEEELILNENIISNKEIRQKIKNLDLSKLKNSVDINNNSNNNNINEMNDLELESNQDYKANQDIDKNLDLKQRKSKDKILFDKTNHIENIHNKTLSDISTAKMNNNHNFIFNSDKEINISNVQNKDQNISTDKGNNNIKSIYPKKSSNSQLNTSDTSFNKLNDMKAKLKNNKLLSGNNTMNNLTNIKELNNIASFDFKNFSCENNLNNAIENEKYLITNNTNEDDYSLSEIGFLSSSNKVDSNGVSRNNRNKFINLEKNFLQTHMENLHANNLIKKYQNLNELGEILDDSKEKNLKSETKEENNKSSNSFLCFDKFTQTSIDRNINDRSAEINNDQEEYASEINEINKGIKNNKFELNSKIKKDYNSDENDHNIEYSKDNHIDSLSSFKLKKESLQKDKKINRKENILLIDNNISDEFIYNSKFLKILDNEEIDLTKNFVIQNSSKILDHLPDDSFYCDLRYLKLKKDYENIQSENERLIINESELLKTITILRDYIKTQEKTFFNRQKEDNSINFLVLSKVREAEVSVIKKEWDKMAKKNNELKLIILKMMHQINDFESEENNRYKSFYSLHNQLIKENEFLRSVSDNIVFPKNDPNILNQFDKGFNSRNRNSAFNNNLYKTDLKLNGNGTIMKDNNSSVVHNESYAEENSFTFNDKENKKNENDSIVINDLNSTGAISDNCNTNSKAILQYNTNNIDDKFSNFFYSSSSNQVIHKKIKKKEDKNANENDKFNDNSKRSKEMINNLIKINKMCYAKKKK